MFVQFNKSVNSAGAPIWRIGSTAATEVNIENCSGCGLSSWGWQDNGYGNNIPGTQVYFEADGPQTIRIQPREDGLSIDQIVLSHTVYLNTSPGALKNDTQILQENDGTENPPPPPPPPDDPPEAEIVLYAARNPVLNGAWAIEADATAADGAKVRHPNAGAAKVATPLAAPTHYFELSFNALAGRPYRLWMRGKGDSNNWANDSVFIQFDRSVDANSGPMWRIGSTSAAEYNLEDCSGCGLSGWGWQDNGWGIGTLGPVVYFEADGAQTIRVQTREDGLAIDQIVLSAETYLNTTPGPLKNDATILTRTQ